jgi:hypothetical protein
MFGILIMYCKIRLALPIPGTGRDEPLDPGQYERALNGPLATLGVASVGGSAGMMLQAARPVQGIQPRR